MALSSSIDKQSYSVVVSEGLTEISRFLRAMSRDQWAQCCIWLRSPGEGEATRMCQTSPGSLSFSSDFSSALRRAFPVWGEDLDVKHDRRYILRHVGKVSPFKEKFCVSEALIFLNECVRIGPSYLTTHQKKKTKTQPINPKHAAW